MNEEDTIRRGLTLDGDRVTALADRAAPRRRMKAREHAYSLKSTKSEGINTLDGDVKLWKVTLSDPTKVGDTSWVLYVIAINVHDASLVAQEISDLDKDTNDYLIITDVNLVQQLGIWASEDIFIISSRSPCGSVD